MDGRLYGSIERVYMLQLAHFQCCVCESMTYRSRDITRQLGHGSGIRRIIDSATHFMKLHRVTESRRVSK
jgi:hypothetical protein